MYLTVIVWLFSNFLPNKPSPNISSYFSSWTSCIKYISDFLSIFKILSTAEYFLPIPLSLIPLTYALMVELSIFGVSKINLWSIEVSTRKNLDNNVPSWTEILSSNWAYLFPLIVTILVEVISSGIENLYVELFALPTHTRPALNVIKGICGSAKLSLISISPNLIVATAAVFERGTYPIFLASDTTFSLIVAESKKDSFATKLALNALIYVLYARVSIKTEKLEPSKSKSVKFEFARR